MKAITKFQANDGTEFATESAAKKRDALLERLAVIMKPMGRRPDSCDFSNGGGYINHGTEVVAKVRLALLAEAASLTDHHWIKESMGDPTIHDSYAGRIIGECSDAIYKCWHRIACCDKQGREWGQPYFAGHPGEAKQKEWKA